MRDFARTWPLWLIAVVFLVHFVVPVALFMTLGFATYVQPGIWTAELTFANYQRALTDEYALGVLLVTLKIGAIVTGLCVLLGYPVAYYIARERGRTRHLVLIIVTASLFTNLIVRTYGWMVFLTPRGLLNNVLLDVGLIERPLKLMFNEAGVIIGMTQINLPVLVLVAAVAIQSIDRVLEQAAAVAGAGPLRIFTKVTWPLSLVGVLSGSALVFALTISNFITADFLGGGRVMILGTMIRQLMTRSLNYPYAAALSGLLLLLALAAMLGVVFIYRALGPSRRTA